MTNNELQHIAQKLRAEAVRMIYEGGDGHPGPALSIADIVTELFFEQMTIDPSRPDWPARDRFILSKGHACPIYYAALNERGYYSPKVEHFELRRLGSRFQGHPSLHAAAGIDMTSGSLGNGVAIGAGMAIACRLQGFDACVYVVTGDGELQEGVCWEGANIAAAHRLGRLIVFVDKNDWQSNIRVTETLGQNNPAQRFEAFGWHVQEIDGHDFSALRAAILAAKAEAERPSCIVCDCIKGKGVSFMENNNKWHKGVPTDAEYATAMKELAGDAQ